MWRCHQLRQPGDSVAMLQNWFSRFGRLATESVHRARFVYLSCGAIWGTRRIGGKTVPGLLPRKDFIISSPALKWSMNLGKGC
jgi:hypothetical protein